MAHGRMLLRNTLKNVEVNYVFFCIQNMQTAFFVCLWSCVYYLVFRDNSCHSKQCGFIASHLIWM